MTLAQISQEDFAVGVLRGVSPDVQPGVGVYEIRNGLLDDDGDIYRRGGTVYAQAAAGDPIKWMWSGRLGTTDVQLYATNSQTFQLVAGAGAMVDTVGLRRAVKSAVVRNYFYLPSLRSLAGTTLANGAWTPPPILAGPPYHLETIAGRLVVAAGNRIAFSAAMPPAEPPPVFAATDYHELPGGVVVMGLGAMQDTLLVFTNFGLWTIANMAFDLTDAAGNVQHTVSHAVPEISLLHEAGLASWSGNVVAPCVDGVYLVNMVSAPVCISNSIAPYWADLIKSELRPGLAKVFRDTLLLPMIEDPNDPDSGHDPVLTLACRLNRPIRGRLLYYPWSVLSGHMGRMSAFDIDHLSASPRLLAGGLDGRVTDATQIFTPDPYVGRDANGTVFPFDVETRDFPTGQGQPNHLKRIRLRYTLRGEPAVIRAMYQLMPDGPWSVFEDTELQIGKGLVASWWLTAALRTRWVRVRFELVTTIEPGNLTIHRVDLNVRQATHAR